MTGKDEPEETFEDAIDSDLNAAFDKLSADPEPEKEAPAPEPEKETEEVEAEETAEEEVAEPEKVEATVEKPLPPKSWSITAKTSWEKLDPTIQKEVLKREDDFHKGIAQYRDGHKFAEEVMKVAQPYIPIIRAEGGNVIGAVSDLLNTAYKMRQDPAGTIAELAHQYGVDLSQVAAQRPVQADPMYRDLQGKIMTLEQRIQQSQYQEEQQRQDWALGEIDRFAKDPTKLYFNDVADDMTLLIQTGRANGLEDAYNKACNMNPEIQKAVSARQQADEGQRRVLEAKKKAETARRAGFEIQGSESTGPGRREMTLDEKLAYEFDRLAG